MAITLLSISEEKYDTSRLCLLVLMYFKRPLAHHTNGLCGIDRTYGYGASNHDLHGAPVENYEILEQRAAKGLLRIAESYTCC